MSASTPIRGVDFIAEVREHRRRHRLGVQRPPAQNATGNWVKVVQRIPVRPEARAEARPAAAPRRHERRGRDRHRPHPLAAQRDPLAPWPGSAAEQ